MRCNKIIDSLVLLEEKICEYELADNNNKPFSEIQYSELQRSIKILQMVVNTYNVLFNNPLDMFAKKDRKYIKTFLKYCYDSEIIDVTNRKIPI